MKPILVLSFLCLTFFRVNAQVAETVERKNNIGGQIGGQLQIGIFYERTIGFWKYLHLNTQVGIGLNSNGDYYFDGTRGTYSFQSGIIMLAGSNFIFLEVGPFINFNKSGSHTFANLNSWFGLRYESNRSFFMGMGYTPKLYGTFTESSNYFDSWLGLKIGGRF